MAIKTERERERERERELFIVSRTLTARQTDRQAGRQNKRQTQPARTVTIF